MKSLEELIRAAVKRGELTHLSLVASPTAKQGIKWRASYRPATGATCFGEDDDPVKALASAMTNAPPRSKKSPTDDEPDFG